MQEQLPEKGNELEQYIRQYEQQFTPLKKGNEAEIVWANRSKEKTKYALVYLHGFTASRGEGAPWHTSIAKHFGCNLYLPRLHSHGLKKDNFFEGFNYPDLLDSALNACRIGQKLGENVVLMGTSTGGTLALYAAGSHQFKINIKGLLLVSPLIHFYGYQSLLLENKWGRLFAKTVGGKDYKYNLNKKLSPKEQQIWYPYAPLSAALALGEMIQHIVTPSLLKNVICPVFTGYYFKDDENHDNVVSPGAIEEMIEQLGTAENQKRLVNFPEAGSHVICSELASNAVPELIEKSICFLDDIIKISS